MTADEAKQSLLNYITNCEQDKRVTLKEERPPDNTPACGWYMGYFDACEDMKSFIEELI